MVFQKSCLSSALEGEKYLPANCFSHGPDGLKEGFFLTTGGQNPPHLKVGNKFVTRARGSEGCLFSTTIKAGCGFVRRAEIREVTPVGCDPFPVLVRLEKERPETFLLHVSFCLPPNRKVKGDILLLRIRYGVCGNAEIVMESRQKALVRLKHNGEYIFVMYEDGTVRKVLRTQDRLQEVSLSPTEMAEARIHQIMIGLENVGYVEDGVTAFRRREGILFGAIDLLQITRNMEEARSVIIDFLTDQELTGPMRRKIREILAGFADAREFCFAENFQNSTVAKRETARNSKPPKARSAHKDDIASASAELRNRMKGSSGGGNKGRKRASR